MDYRKQQRDRIASEGASDRSSSSSSSLPRRDAGRSCSVSNQHPTVCLFISMFFLGPPSNQGFFKGFCYVAKSEDHLENNLAKIG
jgi:hypothetical protein